jgi:hypothetical protein
MCGTSLIPVQDRLCLIPRSLHFTYSILRTYSVPREKHFPTRAPHRAVRRCNPSFLFIIISPPAPPCMSFSPRSSTTGRLGKLQHLLCPLLAVSPYRKPFFAFPAPSQCFRRHWFALLRTPCRLDLSCPVLSCPVLSRVCNLRKPYVLRIQFPTQITATESVFVAGA